MTYIKINDSLYQTQKIEGKVKDEKWNDRSTKTIFLEMSYEQGKEIFINGLNWSIFIPGEEKLNAKGELIKTKDIEYDNSDYLLAGPITDNRDGTVSIKMGKMTEAEMVQKELEETLAIMYAEV